MPPLSYRKPPLPVAEQVALLQSRGMVIADVPAAIQTLEQVSYYRFTGYALPWRQTGTDHLRPGVTFENVLAIYAFDRQLRDLLWQAIEPVEIALRTRITLHLTTSRGSAFAHTDAQWFNRPVPGRRPTDPPKWDQALWLKRVEDETARAHELFLDHYRQQYTGFPRVPMWMAVEVMTFGTLSKMYQNLLVQDQAKIARSIGLYERFLPSWLHALSVIRNACAHHGRCWDRRWGIKPLLPQEAEWDPFRSAHVIDRIGVVIFISYRLLIAIDHPMRHDWRTRMRLTLAPMLPQWGVRMGLPADWFSSPLWND